MIFFGKYFIKKLESVHFCERIKFRDSPFLQEIHQKKEGTPTMGGLFVVLTILVSSLLWAKWEVPVVLSLLVMLLLMFLGAWDDVIKIRTERKGLNKTQKIIFQSLLGLGIGMYIYFSDNIENVLEVPFLKEGIYLGVFYILFSIIVIMASSNAVNLTDGLDGLACGSLLSVGLGLMILSYITGHRIFSSYLFLSYLKGAGELSVVMGAFIGALLGFLWFNCLPAQIFLGDAGALSLGGLLGCVSLLTKKEILLLILGGIFVIETLSVILQILGFRIFKRRVFRVAPLHHHLQAKGWSESKIIVRFWIIQIILAIFALSTLKIR